VTFRIRDARRRQRSDAHARELIELVRDVPCKFNLIPFNPFPTPGMRRSGASGSGCSRSGSATPAS
jgi:hypothetical protein